MSLNLRTSYQRGIINRLPYKGRIIDIDSKYLSDSDQNKVVQCIYGRDLVSTSMIFPPWNLDRRTPKSGGKGGGKNAAGSSSPTFYASIAFAICMGEATSIYAIYESDNLVYVTEPDSQGTNIGEGTELQTSGYGKLRIYKGSPEQKIDPALSTVLVFNSNGTGGYFTCEVPDFKHICYAVADEWKLGSSTSHPNIRVEIFKRCSKLKDDYNTAHPNDTPITETSFIQSGDYAPPVILYELLKDFPAVTKLFTDNPNAILDVDSFVTAAAQCADAGIYISVCLDNSSSMADVITTILEYCDGVVYMDGNKLKIRMPWKERLASGFNPKTFTVNDLIEEPEINYQTDDWGVTKVSFCDRALDYEETTEVLEHPDYEGITGMDVKVEEFNRPFIKNRGVATVLTKYLANVGVKPSVEINFRVVPSAVSGLQVGDLIKVDYNKFPRLSDALFRVNSVSIASDGAEVSAVSECKEFFDFKDSDILFIETEKYLSMNRGFPYLYPKMLIMRNNLPAGYVNGFQDMGGGKNVPLFLFVSESYYAGRTNFVWKNIDSSVWAPNNQNPEIGIEPAYQRSCNITQIYYEANGTAPRFRIKTSFTSDELNQYTNENVLNAQRYYLVCNRYHSVNGVQVASCIPIIFRIVEVSPYTNELVCTYLDNANDPNKYVDYTVTPNDIPNYSINRTTWVSKLGFFVTEEELDNCAVRVNLIEKNRYSAAIYNNEEDFEDTPGYAAVFYTDGQDPSTPLSVPAVLNRSNSNTDDVDQHFVMWPDEECVLIDIPASGAAEEYPYLAWDPEAQNYYLVTGVEPAGDEKNYLTMFAEYNGGYVSQGRRYQEIITYENDGTHLIDHNYGSDSLIYVTVKHPGNSIDLPRLDQVSIGDAITIIINTYADQAGVDDNTTINIIAQGYDKFISRTNNESEIPLEGNQITLAKGVTTTLYCVLKNAELKYWYVDITPGQESVLTTQ